MIGGIEKRVLAFYGGSLWWFLRHRWVSPVIWVVCLAGTIWLFMLVPKAFLPPGDSSVIFGAFIAREGSSPEQMHELQNRVDEKLQQDPNVITDFTMTGATGFLASNQGITFTFIKPPAERPPIAEVTAQMMGKLNSIPGVFTFLRPFPVLEISTGVTSQNQGQYAFAVSGANPQQVYEVGQKLMAKLMTVPRLSFGLVGLLQQHAQRRHRSSSRSGQDLWRLRSANPDPAAQCLFAKLSLPDQEAGRSVPGDSGDARLRLAPSRKILSLLYIKIRRRPTAWCRFGELVTWKTTLGPQAVNHLNQFTSMTLFFNLKPGVALGDATNFISKSAAEVVPPTRARGTAGRGADFQQHGHQLDDPDGPGSVRDVRDSGDPLRELRASADGALDAAYRSGRRIVDACCSLVRKRRSTRSSACSC